MNKTKEKKKFKLTKDKALKYAIRLLIVILIVETIIFGYKYIKNELTTVNYDIKNEIVKTDKGYIAVGLSDYKLSKLNKYEKPGYTKATIWILDKNYKSKKETGIKDGYNSFFNSVIKVEDGYVAVGAEEANKKQHEEQMTSAIIVKFDNDLKVVWKQKLTILDVNEFVKVEQDTDGSYVVVGKSVYGEGYMGNHTTGGAILLKYTADGEESLRINYGGPQAGSFNDIIVEEDGYVVAGVFSTSTGVIKKYNKQGIEMWHSYYGLTDRKGIISITKANELYYAATTKMQEKTSKEYEAALVIFDLNGNKVNDTTYKNKKINRFNDVIVNEDEIVAIGITVNSSTDTKSSGIIVKYDQELNVKDKKLISGKNNITFNKIYENNKNYEILGNANSKIKGQKTNNVDYKTVYYEY